MALILSLAALFLGPLFLPLLERRPALLAAVDAGVLVSVLGLVLLHILPHSLMHLGWPALLAALLGACVPSLLHGTLTPCSNTSPRPLLWLALLPLLLHTFLDGVAVGIGREAPLALAVILHRISEGLGVWWLLRPYSSFWLRLGILFGLAAVTLAGALAGVQQLGGGFWLEGLQAGLAGSLLHVLVRHGTAESEHAPGSASAMGAAVGLGLLVYIETASGHGHMLTHQLGRQLGALLLQLAPAVLMAYALSAALHLLLPNIPARLALPGGTWRQAAHGASLGLMSAVCSCGMLPLYRLNLQRQARGPAALAYLVAAPTCGLAPFLLSLALLPLPMALWRLLATWVLATLTGALVGGRTGTTAQAPAPPPAAPCSHTAWLDGLQFALGEVLDHSAPWLCCGLLGAALLLGCLEPQAVARLSAGGWALPLALVAAAPLYLSASATTLWGSVLLALGAPAGPVLLLLLVGPATSLTAVAFLNQTHGRQQGSLAAGLWLMGSLGIALLANRWLPVSELPVLGPAALGPPAVGLLLVLWGLSLVRQGVRPFLGRIALPNLRGGPSHHHAH